MTLRPEDWPLVKEVFEGARALPADARPSYLATACGDNEALRQEVELLLTSHQRAKSFLETPADVLFDDPMVTKSLEGHRIGVYQLSSRIGAGGMGEVYRARDTKLNRGVAIKVLLPSVANDPDRLARFSREAQVLASLNHPNICTLYDVGENYIVMELLEGESLAERLAKGRLPLSDVLKYGVQIGDALSKAHREGVIHRDLKPGNIMLTKSGAKLLDFGLAKSVMVTSTSEGATAQKPLTQEGMVLGTLQYMAPEQLAAEEPDARTDIFALGSVLYEMATGTHAFEGKTKTSLIGAIVSGEPKAIRELRPFTPPSFEHVVKKCLEKDPEARWQSATDIAEELRWISESGSQTAISEPVTMQRRFRPWLPWSVVGVLAVALATVVSILLIRSPRESNLPSYRYMIPDIDAQYRGAWHVTLSPDGKRLAFLSKGLDGTRRLWLRRSDSLGARPLVGTENAGEFTFSTIGDVIYFMVERKLKGVVVDGGLPFDIVTLSNAANHLSASSTGGVLVTGDKEVLLVSKPGTNPLSVMKVGDPKDETGFYYGSFLPDGKHFLLLVRSRTKQGEEKNQIEIDSTDSETRTPLLAVNSRAEYAPPGFLFFVRAGDLVAVPFDWKHGRITGEEIHIAGDTTDDAENSWDRGFSVSGGGSLAYRQRDTLRLTWTDRSGKELTIIASAPSFNDAAISPDQKRIVASAVDPETRKANLWVYGADRPTASRLTNEASNAVAVAWISNEKIAYEHEVNKDETEIRIISADDPGSSETFVSGPGFRSPTGVTSAGNLIFDYQKSPKEKREIWTVPLDRSRPPQPLVRGPFNVWAELGHGVSPNGKWLLIASNESGRAEMYAFSLQGPAKKFQLTTSGGWPGKWSADGRRILYSHGTGEVFEMDIRESADGTLEAGQPRMLALIGAMVWTDVARDGRLLMARLSNSGTVVVTNWLALRNKEAVNR